MTQQNQPNRIFQKLFGSGTSTLQTQNGRESSEAKAGLTPDEEQIIITPSQLKQFAERMAMNSLENQQRIRQLQTELQQLSAREKTGQISESWVTSASSPSNISVQTSFSQSRGSAEWLLLQNRRLVEQQERLVSALQAKQQLLERNQREMQDLVRNNELLRQRIATYQNMKETTQPKRITNLCLADSGLVEDGLLAYKQKFAKKKIPIVGVKKISMRERKCREISQQTDAYTSNCNDLEVAKLKLQLSRLIAKLTQMQTKNQLLDIQNQHLAQECELANRKQRSLQNYLYQSYLPPKTALDQSRFNVTDFDHNSSNEFNSSFDIMPIDPINSRYLQPPLPPTTPHFSCNMFSLFTKKTNPMDAPPLSPHISESPSEQEQSEWM